MQNDLPEAAQAMLETAKGQLPWAYLLRWKGSKVPRGASVDGTRITWAQHGRLVGEDGSQLGLYERVDEFGGPDSDEHVIACWFHSKVRLVAPDGRVVAGIDTRERSGRTVRGQEASERK
jgi:hypothetical protein